MQVNMIRRVVGSVAISMVLSLATPATANAQTVQLGAELAWGDDVDLGVGAFGKFALTEVSGKAVTGRVTFDLFFPGNSFKYWELNGDGLLDIVNKSSSMKPYVGAGINYGHSSSDNCTQCSGGDVGINAIGGLNFTTSKFRPFVEAKLELRDGGQFILKGGIHF